jgi:hypothetical protein
MCDTTLKQATDIFIGEHFWWAYTFGRLKPYVNKQESGLVNLSSTILISRAHLIWNSCFWHELKLKSRIELWPKI